MDRPLVIIGAVALFALYMLPVFIYPLIPVPVMEVLGGASGIRISLMCFFFGILIMAFAAKSEAFVKKVEPAEEAEPAPAKPVTKFGRARAREDPVLAKMKDMLQPRADTPPPETKPVEFDLDKEYKLAVIKLANGAAAKPVPVVDPVEEQLKAALANYQKSKEAKP